MMLPLTLGYALAGLAGLLTVILVFILFKKLKVSNIAAGFWALFICMFPIAAVVMINSRAAVIKGVNDVEQYMVYGTPTYKLNNGSDITINTPIQNCVIINDTGEDMVLEAVFYGYSTTESTVEDQLVPSMGTLIFDAMAIDYFFKDTPPASISSKNEGAGLSIKYWLRTIDEYAMDHELYDSFDEEGDLSDGEEPGEITEDENKTTDEQIIEGIETRKKHLKK